MKICAIVPNKKYDYLVDLIVEGLNKKNIEIISTDIGNSINKSVSDDEWLNEVCKSDLIISFFGKVKNNNSPKYHLLKENRIKPFPKQNIIYIDGSEWTYNGWETKNQSQNSILDPSKRRGDPWINQDMKKMCGLYFKRETYKVDTDNGIYPLPFGLSLDRHIQTSDIKKDIDVFCVFGHFKTGLRKDVFDAVKKYSQEYPEKKIIVSQNISNDEYKNLLSRSKIVIDAWGGGDCCDRFWEAIGSKACCLYQKYNIEFPNKFENYKNAVEYSNIDEFCFKLNELINNEVLTRDIGNSGFHHAMKYHTSVARVEFILGKVGLV